MLNLPRSDQSSWWTSWLFGLAALPILMLFGG